MSQNLTISFYKLALAGLLCALSQLIVAEELHSPFHCLAGCPSGGADSDDLIVRRAYIVATNDMTKMPRWVAYKVTKNSIGVAPKPKLRTDPMLSEFETLEPSDYKGISKSLKMRPISLVPFASFAGTPYWRDIEYISNVIPMSTEVISGAWSKLEQKERDLAMDPQVLAVYVMVGTIFETQQRPLPKANEVHAIPSGVWKIISIKQTGKIKTAAFYYTQKHDRHMDYCSLMTSIDSIEERSGLNFFHMLTFNKQTLLEQTLPSLRQELGC